MALVKEQFEGLSLDDNSATIYYIISGTTDEIVARNALDAFVDQEYDGKPLEGTGIHERIGTYRWRGWARWSYKTPPDPEYIQYAFDISVGSQHITQSLKTKAIYGAGGPDNHGTIGVTSKGDVHGCDILVPDGAWSETQYFADAEITTAYKHLLRTITGCINKSEFKGDKPGECLFLGVTGNRLTKAVINPGPRESRYDEFYWEMQFRYATSENRLKSNGNPITIKLKDGVYDVDKLGWEYIWYLYETTKATADGESAPSMLIEQPVACYVESVYQEKDFGLIDIGIT